MLLQQHVREAPNQKISDEEALVWCYRNANTEWNNANNTLEIILNLCSCSAKEVDFVKMIRSQIDYVSDRISSKSYQLIHCTIDSNSSDSSSDLSNRMINEIESLKKTQLLLRKKFRLLSIMRKELTQMKCECFNKSNNNFYCHLRKSEFNCQMWFRQIKLIEAKIKCNQELIPFDPITIARQLLENNELNLNSTSINGDINNNDVKNNDSKTEKFTAYDDSNDLAENDCSYGRESYSQEYENSLTDLKNMQILRYDSLLSVSGESSSLVLQPINNNDMTTTTEMDSEVRTFQELHPISSNAGLNCSAQQISGIRSNSLLYHEFDYTNGVYVSDDILPQITAVEIDQILNN